MKTINALTLTVPQANHPPVNEAVTVALVNNNCVEDSATATEAVTVAGHDAIDDNKDEDGIKEDGFVSLIIERQLISIYYTVTLKAPELEEWKGWDGIFVAITKGLRLDNFKLKKVKRVVKDSHNIEFLGFFTMG